MRNGNVVIGLISWAFLPVFWEIRNTKRLIIIGIFGLIFYTNLPAQDFSTTPLVSQDLVVFSMPIIVNNGESIYINARFGIEILELIVDNEIVNYDIDGVLYGYNNSTLYYPKSKIYIFNIALSINNNFADLKTYNSKLNDSVSDKIPSNFNSIKIKYRALYVSGKASVPCSITIDRNPAK